MGHAHAYGRPPSAGWVTKSADIALVAAGISAMATIYDILDEMMSLRAGDLW